MRKNNLDGKSGNLWHVDTLFHWGKLGNQFGNMLACTFCFHFTFFYKYIFIFLHLSFLHILLETYYSDMLAFKKIEHVLNWAIEDLQNRILKIKKLQNIKKWWGSFLTYMIFAAEGHTLLEEYPWQWFSPKKPKFKNVI